MIECLRSEEKKESLKKIIDVRTAIEQRKFHLSVGQLIKEYGIELTEEYVMQQVKHINDIIGFTFNDSQMEDAIEEVIRIQWFTAADFKGLNEMIKIRKCYRLDYKEFLDTFREYIDASLNVAEKDCLAEHLSRKAEEMRWGERVSGIMSLEELYCEYKRKKL